MNKRKKNCTRDYLRPIGRDYDRDLLMDPKYTFCSNDWIYKTQMLRDANKNNVFDLKEQEFKANHEPFLRFKRTMPSGVLFEILILQSAYNKLTEEQKNLI